MWNPVRCNSKILTKKKIHFWQQSDRVIMLLPWFRVQIRAWVDIETGEEIYNSNSGFLPINLHHGPFLAKPFSLSPPLLHFSLLAKTKKKGGKKKNPFAETQVPYCFRQLAFEISNPTDKMIQSVLPSCQDNSFIIVPALFIAARHFINR